MYYSQLEQTSICNFCCDMQIETRNNKLEMQSVNNKALIEELEKLLERLRVPSEVCYPSFFVTRIKY